MGGPVLRAMEVGPGLSRELVEAVRAALEGAGPAVLPVPADAPEPVRSGRVAALRPGDPGAPLEADDVAFVVPTSGSTGEPKGALLTRAAVRASVEATAERLSGPGTWVLAMPATHVGGLMVLARALLAGGEPVVLGGERFEPAAFAAATAQAVAVARTDARPLYVSLVPTQLERLLVAGVDLQAYDAILLGAAAAPAGLLERAREAGARVVTTYGMTETCGGCVYDGRPLGGVTVRVEAAGDAVDVAGPGRVLLGGPTLATGYRLRPDLTSESFGSGWFRTSDLGRWDGARLVLDGRLDDVVVTGGEKVVPGVVERSLAEVVGGGARWCVVGVADDEWGHRVVAVLAAADDVPTPDVVALRDGLRGSLPVAWLPREVVRVHEMPMLASGKVDRVTLAGMVSTQGSRR
jgi:o-succinylbenzoate---CoA ligase